MRAAVFHGRGRIEIEEVPMPEPGADELLVEVGAAGVCGTDASEFTHGPTQFPIHRRHPVTGHLGPLVPGHEFGGTVVAMGSEVAGFSVGDVVASGAGMSCGRCPQCWAGMTNVCSRYATVGLSRHGALAQYVTTPASICVEVGSLGLGSDTAALLQPMAIAHHAFRRGRPREGQPVVVIGVGGIGAFIVHVAARSHGRVLAVDLDPHRLAIASTLGADRVIDPAVEDLAEVVAGFDRLPVVYEVTGTAAGLESAWSILPPGATLVAVGIQEGARPIDLPSLTVGERELVGTNAHVAATDLPAAARLVAERPEGWSDVAPMVFPLEMLVEEGLRPLAEGRADRIKTLFDPSAGEARPLGS
jgi:(R,R)-butanediol dehydrogenase / meso-butanediol dehydrogenase / diacetyl reductase